jgi:2-keto-3-deoxy-galactonokinase
LARDAPFQDGTFSMWVRIKNDGVGQTGTVTVGDASTTLNGTATIATNTVRTYLLTVTSKTTLTLDNFGSSSL